MGSVLTKDDNNQAIQAFLLPSSGSTTVLTTLAANSTATAALNKGVYRINSTGAVTVAKGATALATDMPLAANAPEYFSVDQGDTIAVYSVAGGDTVSITRV